MIAAGQGNPNFDAIVTTTLRNYRTKLADNVTNNIPFLKMMEMKDKMRLLDGGDYITEELLYGENTTVTSFTGTDVISLARQEGITSAQYYWKQVGGSVVMTATDMLRNAGREKIISLLDARIFQTETTISNKVATMLFADGTGNGGKDILGLDAIVSTTPAVGVLGGIDRSDANNSWWRNEANVGGFSFAAAGPSNFSAMVRLLTRGTDRPDLIVVGSDVYGYMQSAAFNRVFFDNPRLADMNFQALKFEGIDVIFDSNCPSDRAYFLNTKYLKFNIHKDYNYKVGEMVPMTAVGQSAKASLIELAAEMTCANCKLQGVIDNIAA